MTLTPEMLTELMAETATRRVFAAVALGATTPAEVLGATGLAGSDAAPAIGRLIEAGLLLSPRFAIAEDELTAAVAVVAERAAAEQPDPQLRGWVRGSVVTGLPEDDDARSYVSRHVAAATFAVGEEYDEPTVTERLRPWCAGGAVDAVSLRRFLVDDGVMTRDGGRYRVVTGG